MLKYQFFICVISMCRSKH